VRGADTLLAEAAAVPTAGWDLSRLGDRVATQPTPWAYEALVCAHAEKSPDLLDLGTGGGEWLAALPCRPPRVVATEGYAANLPVAVARLEPLGIDVVAADAPDNVAQEPGATEPSLPFADESFSLVVARHESYFPAEIARILRGGGVFLTQQVGERNEDDVYRLLGRPVPPPTGWNAAFARGQLRAAGLEVTRAEEAEVETTFADVGAFAWWLRMISFSVPFSLERERERLIELHDRRVPLVVRERRFLVEARKGGV
jgi:SAM-dependent methyltransferase